MAVINVCNFSCSIYVIMRFLLLMTAILFSYAVNSQCKTYRIGSKGDTLNCTDRNGWKQGKWKIQAGPLRGEPGFEEEGVYVNGKKEGIWRRYNLMGDIRAIEQYKWGFKHGASRYYEIAGLEREESWRSLDPAKAFDTIEVPDANNPDKYERVIVKNEGSSLRHGTWRYYFPATGQLLRTENYFLDELKIPGVPPSTGLHKKVTDTTAENKGVTADKAKPKPKEVLEFEKKNSGKKKTKIRDGKTGG